MALRIQNMSRTNTCPISVIIPTSNRPEKLEKTILNILKCVPVPDEIIVYVDGEADGAAQHMLEKFTKVKVLSSTEQLGQNEGRNRLVSSAKNDIVASFDDDSYPIDEDYFAKLYEIALEHSDAAVIASQTYEASSVSCVERVPTRAADPQVVRVSNYRGGASAFRRTAFLEAKGYVPVRITYGMEEGDLALRLFAAGWRIVVASHLRVFHDTSLQHRNVPEITAASIANLALLSFLRYPFYMWLLGGIRCCRRIAWLVSHRRYRGIVEGIFLIPVLLWRYRKYRAPVPVATLVEFWRLTRKSVPIA